MCFVLLKLKRLCCLVAVFGLMVGSGAQAEEVASPDNHALTIQACLAKTFTGNPALQAAALRREAAQERVGQARAMPNPRIEVEAENFGGRGDYNGWAAAESTLGFSQEIELAGKRGARAAEAEADASMAQAEYEATKRDLTRDVRRAYVTVLLAMEKQRLAEAALRLAEEVEKLTAVRIAAGKTTPLESDRIRVESLRTELARDEAEQELDSARQELASLWGGSDGVVAAAEGALADIPSDLPVLASLLAGIDRMPDIVRAKAAIRSAEARLRGEKAERLPNVEVSAGFRRFEDTGDSAFVAGLGVEIPLFNRNVNGIRSATAGVEAARQEASAVRIAWMLDLRLLHARLLNQKKRIETLGGIGLPAAERALAGAQTGYREGKFGYLEVLDAQRVYAEFRVEQAEALADFHRGMADVERLTVVSTQASERQ